MNLENSDQYEIKIVSTKISRLSKTKLGLHYYTVRDSLGLVGIVSTPRGLIDRARLPAHVLIYSTPSSYVEVGSHLQYKIVALLDERLIFLNTSTY